VNRRIALIVATIALALAIPAAAAAAPPKPGDPGYCPGGEFVEFVEEFGGQALGDVMDTYQQDRGYTFGEGVQIFCHPLE
jgi:hypothetical protein